jgi:hypothetical protein
MGGGLVVGIMPRLRTAPLLVFRRRNRFVVGFSFASRLCGGQPQLTALLIGLGAGLLGVVLALLLQRFAIVVAGLLAGAWLGAEAWRLLATTPLRTPWLPALVGGVVGALLAATLFGAVLVVLSSLVGAAIVAERFGGTPGTQAGAFLLLALLGIVFQGRTRRRET